jgi:hypothetical protein
VSIAIRNLPGYKGVDLTLAKAFGLPKAPVLSENARIEFRVDVYNLFNNLNLNPNQISNNIGSSNSARLRVFSPPVSSRWSPFQLLTQKEPGD